MNLHEYCQSKNFDISKLSHKSLEALSGSFLEGIDIDQTDIDLLQALDSGEISPEESLKQTIAYYKKLAAKQNGLSK